MRKNVRSAGSAARFVGALSAVSAGLLAAFMPALADEVPASAVLSQYTLPTLSVPVVDSASPTPVVTGPITKSTTYTDDTALSFKTGTSGTINQKNSGFFAGSGKSVVITDTDHLLRLEGSALKFLLSEDETSELTVKAGNLQVLYAGSQTFLSASGSADVEVTDDILVNAPDSLSLIDVTGGSVLLKAGGNITLIGNEVSATNQVLRYGTVTIEAGGNIWIDNPDPFWGESDLQGSMNSSITIAAQGNVYLTGNFTLDQSWVLCAAGADIMRISGDSVYILRSDSGAMNPAGQAVWSYDSDVDIKAEKLIYIVGGIDNNDSLITINTDGTAAVALQGDLEFSNYKQTSGGTTTINFGENGVFIGAVLPYTTSVQDTSLKGTANLTLGSGSVWQITKDSRVGNLNLDNATLDFGADQYTGLVVDNLVSNDSTMWLTIDTRDLGKVDYLQANTGASGELNLRVHSSGVGDGTASGPVVIVPADSPLTVGLKGYATDANGVPEVDIGDFLYTIKTETVGNKKYTYFTHVIEDRLPDSTDEGSENGNSGSTDEATGGESGTLPPSSEGGTGQTTKPDTGNDSAGTEDGSSSESGNTSSGGTTGGTTGGSTTTTPSTGTGTGSTTTQPSTGGGSSSGSDSAASGGTAGGTTGGSTTTTPSTGAGSGSTTTQPSTGGGSSSGSDSAASGGTTGGTTGGSTTTTPSTGAGSGSTTTQPSTGGSSSSGAGNSSAGGVTGGTTGGTTTTTPSTGTSTGSSTAKPDTGSDSKDVVNSPTEGTGNGTATKPESGTNTGTVTKPDTSTSASPDKNDSTSTENKKEESKEPAQPVVGQPVPEPVRPVSSYVLSPSAFAMLSVGSPNLIAAHFQSDLDDLRERIGEIRTRGVTGAYGQVIGGGQRVRNIAGTDTKNRYASARIGMDRRISPEFFLSGAVKFSDLTQKAYYRTYTAKGSANAQIAQLYGTWVHPKGWYADTALSFIRYEQTIKTAMLDGTPVRANATHFGGGASLEAGRKIDVESPFGLFIEPQLQLSYLALNGKRFEGSNGMSARQKAVQSFTGRAGIVFGGETELGAKKSLLWTLKGGVKHEFLHPNAIYLNEVRFNEESLGTRGYIGAGLDYRNGATGLYLNLQRETGHYFREDWKVSCGVKIAF